MDPAARPSAHELGDRIQRYLDGDRDLERRRALASELVAEGREAVAAGRRADAVRSCGRALAMDPASAEAAALIKSLVLETPAQLPAEVEAAIAQTEATARRERSRRAVVPYLLFFLFTPFVPLLHVKSWPLLLAIYGVVTMMAGACYLHWRTGRMSVAVQLVLNLVTLTVVSRLSGPFMLTPMIIGGVLLSLTAVPWLNDRRLAVVGFATAAVLLPFALEELGVFARGWEALPTGMLSKSTVFEPDAHVGLLLGLPANLALTIVFALFARAISRDRRLAQRHLQSQTWHLHQLLPRPAGTPEAAA
jgi:serine/threonine-protein kinase